MPSAHEYRPWTSGRALLEKSTEVRDHEGLTGSTDGILGSEDHECHVDRRRRYDETYTLLLVPLHDSEGALILDILHDEPVQALH